ncbi:GAF domain-containing protein [Candidatus Chloroploca sp. M-50]|uniref:histidine kinase n=1 Tax=Candidatus Chloroploca mongolica TaxID=2528176 RepID=A0ABS4DAP7_9CHLR|nr:ATP-binding protein [Candidatus Chloroploca mongolica]MBP1466507.1 GAF domain-containing protein [Candidatus Chloroploca mongolica]
MSQESDFSIDLTSCDREPIHIPGSIQPHGVLFALTEPDLTVVQSSANTFAFLGRHPHELLGQPVSTLLGDEQTAYLRKTLASEQVEENPLYTFTLTLSGVEQHFDVISHRTGGMLILELEPSTQGDQSAALRVYRMVKGIVAACQRTATVRAFAQTLAGSVRKLTGFDRVMVYQFQSDGTGIVIAEEKRDDFETYLDLRYPASDIPRQARALYLRNWLRLIPDVAYQPVPMLAAAPGHPSVPLDMSFAALRSVSPIHIEYLMNMEVQASMSISLIKNDQLWGLIACHHHTGPHYLPYDIRAACEFLGHMVSLQIGEKEAAEDAAYTIALQGVQAELVQHMSMANDVVAGLTSFKPNLMQFVEADGVAVCLEGQCVLLGETPPESAVRQLTNWLAEEIADSVFATEALPEHYPPITPFAATASGLLAVRLARSRPNYLLWFRPEVIRSVRWGGNPEKPVEVTEGVTRLSPRKSFEVWKETVTRTALPWRTCEVTAARDLRRAIIDLVLYKTEELSRLNDELTRSNVELDSFAYVASHDLKEPLRGLHNYAHFLIEDYGEQLDDEGKDKLTTLIRLTQRMETLIDSLLHYSRVGRLELTWVDVDLNAELADVVALLEPRLHESDVELRIPQSLPQVHADQARVREVFSNLITNAIKYNDNPEKWVEIGYQPLRGDDGAEQYMFFVRDNGIGIPEEHQEAIFRIFKRLHGRDEYGGGVGAGLTIVKKIIERHGGTIWLTSQPDKGSTFWFTLGKVDTDLQQMRRSAPKAETRE